MRTIHPEKAPISDPRAVDRDQNSHRGTVPGVGGWRWLSLLALTLALLPWPALAETQPAFGPGEVLVYDIRYGPLSSGKARILVGADTLREGERVWPIVVQARTSKSMSRFFDVQDQLVSLYDPRSGTTLGYDFLAREGGKRRSTRARLDREKGKATVIERSDTGPERRRTHQVGQNVQDLASAMFWLRGRALEVGDRERVRIFTGARTWDLHGLVEGRETMMTPQGERTVVRVRFQSHRHGKRVEGRDITLWFTDDQAHIPVQIHAELFLGALRAELSTYQPGLPSR